MVENRLICHLYLKDFLYVDNMIEVFKRQKSDCANSLNTDKDDYLMYLTFVNLKIGAFVHYGKHSAKWSNRLYQRYFQRGE